MNKGTKYYSINGRKTKNAIQNDIVELKQEIENYEKAKGIICNLCMVKSDHDIIGAILNTYIIRRNEKLAELEEML